MKKRKGTETRNIVLVGFMGTGKTEVGRVLSKRLGIPFIDTDTEIVKEQGMSIADIFSTRGEPCFRDIETETIRKISARSPIVIATGGGAVLRQENINLLRSQGIIVCLQAKAETIFARTEKDESRPLLQKGENRLANIREMLDRRRPFYEQADFCVDTEDRNPREIAEMLLELICTRLSQDA